MINRMRNVVQRNFMAKAISLLVAIFLWMIVMDDQNPAIEKEYVIPVAMENTPRGYKITKDIDDTKIKVRAQRSYFLNVDSGDFKAKVDMGGLEAGNSVVPIHVQAPQGFEMVELQPENVNVFLDPFIEKQVRVELIVTGSTAPSATVAQISQSHPTATVLGPKSAVDTVARIIGYVGLTGNDSDFDLQVPLSAINEEGREVEGVRVAPSTTSVSVQLARGLSKKVVLVKPNLGKDLPEGYAVDAVRVSPSNIEIAGDEKVIGSIQEIETEPISLKEKESTFTASAKLVLPEGITVTNPEVSVNIVVNKKDQKKKAGS